nr:hypothetical protein [uncultured Albidiferax sp.]
MHEPMLRRLGLLSLVTLAACSSVVLPPPAPPPPAPPAAVSVPPPAPAMQIATPPKPPQPEPADEAGRQLLRWQETLRVAAPDTLPALAARLAAEPATPAGTVHLALVWMNTRTPGDVNRALPLLEQLQQSADPAAQPWVDWARLLATRAGEQKRLEELVARQSQQLRDSQRRIDQLNEQLEALKAIERSLAPRRLDKAP